VSVGVDQLTPIPLDVCRSRPVATTVFMDSRPRQPVRSVWRRSDPRTPQHRGDHSVNEVPCHELGEIVGCILPCPSRRKPYQRRRPADASAPEAGNPRHFRAPPTQNWQSRPPRLGEIQPWMTRECSKVYCSDGGTCTRLRLPNTPLSSIPH
jgi:hypothetical protein